MADSIVRWGRRHQAIWFGEDSMALPGFSPAACYQRTLCERGRPADFRMDSVESDKPWKWEWLDETAGVGSADSTLSMGKPCTRGSGWQLLNLLRETWASCKGGFRPFMQRKEPPIMQTGLKRIADKARKEANLKFTSLNNGHRQRICWYSISCYCSWRKCKRYNKR